MSSIFPSLTPPIRRHVQINRNKFKKWNRKSFKFISLRLRRVARVDGLDTSTSQLLLRLNDEGLGSSKKSFQLHGLGAQLCSRHS